MNIQDWRTANVFPIEKILEELENELEEIDIEEKSPRKIYYSADSKRMKEFVLELVKDLRKMQKYGVDMLHVDIPFDTDHDGYIDGIIIYSKDSQNVPLTYGALTSIRIPPALASLYRKMTISKMKPALVSTIRPNF